MTILFLFPLAVSRSPVSPDGPTETGSLCDHVVSFTCCLTSDAVPRSCVLICGDLIRLLSPCKEKKLCLEFSSQAAVNKRVLKNSVSLSD